MISDVIRADLVKAYHELDKKNTSAEDSLETYIVEALVREYPNSDSLILSLACMVDAQGLIQEIEDSDKYSDWIRRCYEQVLDSKDGVIRLRAADCLYSFYMRKEQCDKAEGSLEYFSIQNPERKRKLAEIYSKTGRFDEAYKALEEVVFSEYQIISGALHGIYMIAMKTENHEKADDILERMSKLCDLFDMGAYKKASVRLDYYAAIKDAANILKTMDELLENTDSLLDFTKSELFAHMDFKKTDMSYMEKFMKTYWSSFEVMIHTSL